MARETETPIDVNDVYRAFDMGKIKFVVIDGFYVDESGETQIRVMQYEDKPLRAHNSVGYYDGYTTRRTLALEDVRSRILDNTLEFSGKD